MAIPDVMNRIAQLQGRLSVASLGDRELRVASLGDRELTVTRRPKNASAAQFADTLQSAASGYVASLGDKSTVSDRTEKVVSRNANTAAAVPLSLGARPAGLTATASLSGSVSGIPYADLFNAAGAKYGVEPLLLAAVARVESDYNHRAVSRAGAQGLMQIMPSTARALGVDAFDPAQAVDGAARILKANLEEFGSLDLALAAYNAGGGAVKRHRGIPPYAETKAYVPKVKAALAALGG